MTILKMPGEISCQLNGFSARKRTALGKKEKPKQEGRLEVKKLEK